MKSHVLPAPGLKICCVAAGLICLPAISQAALYAYNAYAVLGGGSGNTFYDIDVSTGNPDFVGHTFTIDFGQSLRLGGEVTSDAGNGEPAANGPEWALIGWKIDGGADNFLSLPSLTDHNTAGWKVTFQQADYSAMAEIGNTLGIGTHTLEVWFQTHDNNQPWDAYVNNEGLNYSAMIQVVPEPAEWGLICAAGMLGIGLLRTCLRRTSALPKT